MEWDIKRKLKEVHDKLQGQRQQGRQKFEKIPDKAQQCESSNVLHDIP